MLREGSGSILNVLSISDGDPKGYRHWTARLHSELYMEYRRLREWENRYVFWIP
jgi:hypothetical protein